jgi:hypothetical protein
MGDKKELLDSIIANRLSTKLDNLEKRFKTEGADITYCETTMDTLKSKSLII